MRPDWLVGALDDSVHSCRMPLVEGEPDLERAVRKLLAADDAGPIVRAVVAWILRWSNSEFVESGSVTATAQSATAKQIADECGDLRVALAGSTCCRRSRARSGRCR